MVVKTSETFECLLYIGSREGYHGKEFTEEELIEKIQFFQDTHKHPVRLSSTQYIAGWNYVEKGFEIASITYPNSEFTPKQVKEMMVELAKFLLEKFKQNRITVRLVPSISQTIMIEANNPESK